MSFELPGFSFALGADGSFAVFVWQTWRSQPDSCFLWERFVKEQGSALALCAEVYIYNKLLGQNNILNVVTWDTDFQISSVCAGKTI